jgi:hypothetical protein
MQVDIEPSSVNVIDFEGKRVLIRPSTTDKGKGKEIIIGDARGADGNNKISCRKVVTEKNPDRRETLKVTITTSGTGVQALGRRLTVRRIPADDPAILKTRNVRVPSSHDDQR